MGASQNCFARIATLAVVGYLVAALAAFAENTSPLLAEAQAWVCGAPNMRQTLSASDERFNPNAADSEAPWMAHLEIIEDILDNGDVFTSRCGAAVIDSYWLLTAAHCVGAYDWVGVNVTVGARDTQAPSAVRRTVDVALCHNQFDQHSLSHDIALMRLSKPLPLEAPTLRVASAVETGGVRKGDVALSAGWGRTSQTRATSLMRRAYVQVIDPGRSSDGKIVAAPNRDEPSLCVGDSGGPLVIGDGYNAALIGVFSNVDAVIDSKTGLATELCVGFEARSYFTPIHGLKTWVYGAINACESDLAGCLGDAGRF